MNNRAVIDLSEYGSSIGSRELGVKIRAEVSNLISNNSLIEFNFHGISIISSAFADELFGKLYQSLGNAAFKEKIRLTGFVDDQTKSLILQIIQKGLSLRSNMLNKSSI